jgi:hypothetical protein
MISLFIFSLFAVTTILCNNVFLPRNYISKLQPIDAILQKSSHKCEFITWFKRWLASFIKDQIDGGASEINLNIFIGTLHEHLCTWLFESWREVKSHIDMIVKGVGKCGLLRLVEKDFQMKANTKGLSFGSR